ncbi:hypothetical protein [Massilia yuzhufengensis]|uniref:ABC-2 type transport system permease protein n=1 Tax=Massilia yuzhufengensis TaxID=1164594 RepID=A0A1I1IGN5_9BURK|nr:hypothetical protein [Massilia yuzhufengensis]SFC33398.1 hypothetical protein SAMN05216204_105151 [Massilia yuzhufengensis]
MNGHGHTLLILAANEVRLRMRRLSTLVAVLAIVIISWAMIEDPSTGRTLLIVEGRRVLYTSSALALGSATLGGMLFALAGFFLARGRTGEDLRSGIGGVVGATPAGNLLLVASRWLGAVGGLLLLLGAFMLTILALHLLRGDGAINPFIYLQTYAVLLLPMVLFTASCAVLCDSWAPLMGKAGDILYFFAWTGMLSVGGMVSEGVAAPGLAVLDFTGMAQAMAATKLHLATDSVGIGMMPFDAALAPHTLAPWLWSADVVAGRLLTCVLALVPLLPAVLLFHRFSPDRVKAGRARQRRSPLALLNGWLRPLARLVQPLMAMAARLPGTSGQVLADAGLVLMTAPTAILAIGACVVGGVVLPAAVLPGLLAGAVAYWGILCSDSTTRDIAAGCDGLSAAVPGGAPRRFVRQWAASVLLGALFTGAVVLRWSVDQPVRAFAVVAGVVALAGFAALFGQLSRTPRLFLGLFLFGLYVVLNAKGIAMLDVVGFHGDANLGSASTFLVAGVAALAAGIAWSRRAG